MKKICGLSLSLCLAMPLIAAETPPTTTSAPSTPQIITNAPAVTPTTDLDTKHPELTTFIELVRASQLRGLFEGTGPYTIFMPNNEALSKYGKDKTDRLLKPENHDQLSDFVMYHFVPGKYTSKSLKTTSMMTLEGKKVEVKADNGQVKVNSAKVVQFDIEGKNGVIHIIDGVLIP